MQAESTAPSSNMPCPAVWYLIVSNKTAKSGRVKHIHAALKSHCEMDRYKMQASIKKKNLLWNAVIPYNW